jgi:hypothetical protein
MRSPNETLGDMHPFRIAISWAIDQLEGGTAQSSAESTEQAGRGGRGTAVDSTALGTANNRQKKSPNEVFIWSP